MSHDANDTWHVHVYVGPRSMKCSFTPADWRGGVGPACGQHQWAAQADCTSAQLTRTSADTAQPIWGETCRWVDPCTTQQCQWASEQMFDWLREGRHGWMNGRKKERMNEFVWSILMNEWIHRWTDKLDMWLNVGGVSAKGWQRSNKASAQHRFCKFDFKVCAFM